jgi:tetratricopeptide (TPR) repeat protein
MRKFTYPFVLLCLSFSFLFSQAPSVQLKIKEKSGFLGMGGPRFIELELSNKNQQPLTSTNVNEAQYFYFLCKPVGDWQFTTDFLTEDLPKLSLYQNEQKLGVAWNEQIAKDAKVSSLLIGFPKTLRINQLFLIQSIGDVTSQVEFNVPPEYWPGYDAMMSFLREAESRTAAGKPREAILFYERILGTETLQIFPQYSEVKDRRTKLFEEYFQSVWESYSKARSDAGKSVKEKIAGIDQQKPELRYVVDSLAKPTLNISPVEPAVKALLDRANDAIRQMGTERDSLQQVLDDQNIRWIIDGSVAGRSGYLYKDMIEVLSYAFSSLNFRDTTAKKLVVALYPEHQGKLVKNNLVESYETFIKVCNERFQNSLPIFPVDFLPNLRKDTAAFSLPVYSVLKAVNDYFYGNLSAAKEEILKVFRHSYDAELTGRMDQMRIMIQFRTENIPDEALNLIEEAEAAEAKNDQQAASEKYRQATIIAPTFAYAYFSYGKYFVRTGEPIRAITFLQRAYQLDTLFLSAYREAYNIYRRGSNYKPMIEVLTYALQKGNDFWEVNFNLGHAYMGDSDPARAIQHFERALALNPMSYTTNIQLGLAFQTMKNYQRAREYFNNAINIDPLRQDAVDFLNKLNELQRTSK